MRQPCGDVKDGPRQTKTLWTLIFVSQCLMAKSNHFWFYFMVLKVHRAVITQKLLPIGLSSITVTLPFRTLEGAVAS
jgi:hypothetical protein